MQLNQLVRHRLVMMLIKMLRAPALAAGFGLLQSFLEKGLFASRAMDDGTEFIDTIWRRESEAMRRLLVGDEKPFVLVKCPG